jgi:hypothetical protein
MDVKRIAEVPCADAEVVEVSSLDRLIGASGAQETSFKMMDGLRIRIARQIRRSDLCYELGNEDSG